MAKASKSLNMTGPKCGHCGAASQLQKGNARWAKCERGHKLFSKKG